jgi:hypothetical protein
VFGPTPVLAAAVRAVLATIIQVRLAVLVDLVMIFRRSSVVVRSTRLAAAAEAVLRVVLAVHQLVVLAVLMAQVRQHRQIPQAVVVVVPITQLTAVVQAVLESSTFVTQQTEDLQQTPAIQRMDMEPLLAARQAVSLLAV